MANGEIADKGKGGAINMSEVINWLSFRNVFIVTLVAVPRSLSAFEFPTQKSTFQQGVCKSPDAALKTMEGITTTIAGLVTSESSGNANLDITELGTLREKSNDILMALELGAGDDPKSTWAGPIYQLILTTFQKQGNDWV